LVVFGLDNRPVQPCFHRASQTEVLASLNQHSYDFETGRIWRCLCYK